RLPQFGVTAEPAGGLLGGVLPGGGTVRERVHLGAPGIGELEVFGSGVLCGSDQLLVLEERQCRVDRARTRSPRPAAALGQFPDDPVAVHGAFREEEEYAVADIPAASSSRRSSSGPASSAARPAPAAGVLGTEGAVRSERPAGSEGAARPERPAGSERALGAELTAVTAVTAAAAATTVAAGAASSPRVVVAPGVSSPAAAGVSCMARAEGVAAAVSGGAEAVRTEVDVVAVHRSSPLRWVDACVASGCHEYRRHTKECQRHIVTGDGCR